MPNWSHLATSFLTGAAGAGAVLLVSSVELQPNTPGTKQTGHINVSGTVLAGKIGVSTNAPVGRIGVATTDNVVGVHSRTGGIGVWGQSSRPATGYGGYFSANGTSARGVFAEATSSAGATFGGEFVSRSSLGAGAIGRSPEGFGLKGVGVIGMRGEGSTGGQFLGKSSGLEAFASESGSFFNRAFHAFNSAANTGGQLGSSYGGVYSFDIVVGEYNNRNNEGVPFQVSPVAFGRVDTSGNVFGPDNLTTAFNNATKKWELIPRPGTDLTGCAIVVTPFTEGFRATAQVSGVKALVEILDTNGNRTNGAFSFIMMRTGPAPLK